MCEWVLRAHIIVASISVGIGMLLLTGCTTVSPVAVPASSNPFTVFADSKVSAFVFADIGSNEHTGASYGLRLGIIPVDNPFWTVEDTFLQRRIDYSGYAVELCEEVRERCISSKSFPAVIELPSSARQLVEQGQLKEVNRKWGVDLIMMGKVLDSKGILQLSLMSKDGGELLKKTFDNCWDIDSLCSRMLVAISHDKRILECDAASKGTDPRPYGISQPSVATSMVKLRCAFQEDKGTSYGNAKPTDSPILLPFQIAAIAYGMASSGPHAEGELVVLLDGKNVGGHLKPSEKGAVKRRYEWENEIAVRPGRHRVIVGGVMKGDTRNDRRNTYFTEFEIADNETKNITLIPDESKQHWEIRVDSANR